MNKQDFKKLALLGMAGGLLVSAQSTEAKESNQNDDYGNYLAGHGCGSGGYSCANMQATGQNNPPTYYSPNPQDQFADNAQSKMSKPVNQPNQSTGQAQKPAESGCSSKNNAPKSAYQDSGIKPEDYGHVPYYNPRNIVAEGPAAGKSAMETKMTEADLMKELNAQGKATYQSMTPEGKALALKMANQSCKGKNECKGLNSCKTDEHACAGKGGCKGQSKCSFKDKNDAVKVAAQKMAEKRNSVTNPK